MSAALKIDDSAFSLPAMYEESPLFDQLCLNAEQTLESAEITTAQKAQILTNYSLYFRQTFITQKLAASQGRAILDGPFKGQKLFPNGALTGSSLPRLMGNYEYELHGWLNEISTIAYDTIINVGSAEGYYAVGLARLIPSARIYAAEILPNMRELTQLAAKDNGVEERVTVVGGISSPNLNGLIRGRTLVFCDIEGAEKTLLDPSLAPKLVQADMLVELHEVYEPGLIELLKSRFAETHTYRQVEPGDGTPILPSYTQAWSDIDRTLLTFEGRAGYTPWGWWQSKSAG